MRIDITKENTMIVTPESLTELYAITKLLEWYKDEEVKLDSLIQIDNRWVK